jgi:hypothetical protein
MSNPAASFEPYRHRLLGLAYRMLGSMADAEDAVQETYLRWHSADRGKVSDPRAFLMTMTTRICLGMLTSARARREEYVGPWLPEPVIDTTALAPDTRTELAEFASGKRSQGGSSFVARALWAVRWKLGKVLGWDRQGGAPDQVPTLRDRLPADLRAAPSGPTFTGLPFKPLYLLDDEFAAEIVNRTVHGVLHLGWIPNGTGGYSAEMAVYVKPNGLLGTVYMAAIKPFRHLIVYPVLMRDIAREWAAGIGPVASGDTRHING